MALGSPDLFAPADDSAADLLAAPVAPTGGRETREASPDAPLALPADPRAALEQALAVLTPEQRTDFLARFDALDAAGKKAFAAESEKIFALFREARINDGKRMLDKVLPHRKKENKEDNEKFDNALAALVKAIGPEKIKASPKYAEAGKKITEKTHPDPAKREEARVAYAVLHDTGLQQVARQNLGEDKANDLLFDLQRRFPDPKTPPITDPKPGSRMTGREENHFAALG